MENSSTISTVIAPATASGESAWPAAAGAAPFGFLASSSRLNSAWRPMVQIITAMARNAAAENQARLAWPRGTMMNAASNGPSAPPACPPTWKMPCASPCWPPDAVRAMRVASGWKIEEPRPTHAAEASSSG